MSDTNNVDMLGADIVTAVSRREEWIGHVIHAPFLFALDVAREAIERTRREERDALRKQIEALWKHDVTDPSRYFNYGIAAVLALLDAGSGFPRETGGTDE